MRRFKLTKAAKILIMVLVVALLGGGVFAGLKTGFVKTDNKLMQSLMDEDGNVINTDKDDAVTTANKVCLAVRNNKFTLANNEKVNVTISVGVSTVGINGEKPQEIIEFADKCLYVAKENGRNQVVSVVD